MSDEKRKIILKDGEREQTHWLNGAVSAKPGKAIEVSASQAVQAIETGRFEYAKRGAPDLPPVNDLELPSDFPFKKELASVGIHTLPELNGADDETVKGAKNVSAARLKEIREAALTLNKGE